MDKCSIILSLLLLPLFASCVEKQVYIVYFGVHSGDKTLHEIHEHHHSYLLSVKESEEDARSSLLYSYKHSINGFAAELSSDEATKLSRLDEVVSVTRSDPNEYLLHTTRSWEFLGLEKTEIHQKRNVMDKRENLLVKARYGRDVIVGVMDSGVWPESKSFSDEGMDPIPKSWKGICQSGQAFNSSHCNKKLIGARYYIKGFERALGLLNTTTDYLSPRDKDGHGTHTASTAVGRRVHNVQIPGGFARGTASGGAPLARLAIYKACWAMPGQEKAVGNTCFKEDMFAAIDDAIGDGVDVLSLSIGTTNVSTPFIEDGISVGAYHAIRNNIVVVASAGNEGPKPGTLSNTAPWMITVAASSVDRMFYAPVKFGNGVTIEGETVSRYKMKNQMYPLVYAGDVVSPSVNASVIGQCLPDSLSPEKVRGKIVLCFRGNGSRVGKGMEVKRAGGVGFILGNSLANGADISVDPHFLPASAVSHDNAIKIMSYINSTKNPTATIVPAKTLLNTKPAPFMATFSSRGPNPIDPDILKPDITAPGLNIMAAWSGGDSPTKLAADPNVVKYNILSGTSMSCPHVSGVAALLKAVHPDWSAAAIRSALMTTAGLTNNIGQSITDATGAKAAPFQFGAGHLRSQKAADPGLVYDASIEDYQLYLCSIGAQAIDPSFKCPEMPPSSNNLNYPSLSISKLNGTVTVQRTVTNVGGGKGVYFSSVRPPLGFSVKVSPSMLFFKRVGEKRSFTITVKAREKILDVMKNGTSEYAFGWYTWSDGMHFVRSPLAVSLP